MAENKAPTEGQSATAPAADQPGRPYYESLRTTLRGTLDKKRKLDDQLAALEDQIFKLEGAYLEETSNSGNIVRGFDGWVKGVSVGGRSADDRRRGRIREEDRVFSRSSVGWMRVSAALQWACQQSLRANILFPRRKKVPTPTRPHMQLRPQLRFLHHYHAPKARRALLERLETRRREPLRRMTTRRKRRSVGRSLMRGTEPRLPLH